MAQENKPRFSHITVGQSPVEEATHTDEEVITIGAIDDSSEEIKITETASGLSGNDESLESQTSVAASHNSNRDDESSKHSKDEIDYSDLGGPMPVAQKIVLACCVVGFIVAIVLVVWFWSSPQ